MRTPTAVIIIASLMMSPSAAAEETTEQIGKWSYMTVDNKMDDTLRYIAFVGQGKGTIAIRCDAPGRRSVYAEFYAESYLGGGSNETRTLKYRIDNGRPVEGQWRYKDQQAYLLDWNRARSFAEDIAAGQRLIVHAYDYELVVVEAEIDLAGADQAVARLVRECEG